MMLNLTTYIEPAKGKLKDYDRIIARRENIIQVKPWFDRWVFRKIWPNKFGGGKTDYYLLGKVDNRLFTHAGTFTLPISQFKELVTLSLQHTIVTARTDIHEWKYELEGGEPRFKHLPVAKIGDSLTLLRPHMPHPGCVVVRSKQGQVYVVYFESLLCPQDEAIITPSGSSSAT